MLYLAYDGSLNGDWVSRYAVRFAARTEARELRLLHVADGSVPTTRLRHKLERLEHDGRAQGVRVVAETCPIRDDVLRTLLRAIPPGGDHVVVCGTRVRSRGQAYLAGTVSDKLLRSGPFNVLAVRVVQPGLLGHPSALLVPLAGHPRGLRAVWPFLRLFLPGLESLTLLRGMAVRPLQFAHLSLAQTQKLRAEGAAFLRDAEEEIRREQGGVEFHLDSRVVVSDDMAREILVHASKLKAHLILLGASERGLPRRLVSRDLLERVLRETPCDAAIYRGT